MARFLLASDDAWTRIGVARALERAGHTADHVTHLKLASEEADLYGVGAVLVALQQPEHRDLFVAGLRKRDPEIPVVVLLDAWSPWREPLGEAAVSVVLRQPVEVRQVVDQLEDLAGVS